MGEARRRKIHGRTTPKIVRVPKAKRLTPSAAPVGPDLNVTLRIARRVELQSDDGFIRRSIILNIIMADGTPLTDTDVVNGKVIERPVEIATVPQTIGRSIVVAR